MNPGSLRSSRQLHNVPASRTAPHCPAPAQGILFEKKVSGLLLYTKVDTLIIMARVVVTELIKNKSENLRQIKCITSQTSLMMGRYNLFVVFKI